MSCREFIDFLWRYLAEELPPDQRREFDTHLKLCPDCVAYLRSYEQTILMGRKAFDDAGDLLPSDVPEDLVQAILESRDREV